MEPERHHHRLRDAAELAAVGGIGYEVYEHHEKKERKREEEEERERERGELDALEAQRRAATALPEGATYAGGVAPPVSYGEGPGAYGEPGAYREQGAYGAPQAYGRPGAYPEEPQAPGYGYGERSAGGEAAYGAPQPGYYGERQGGEGYNAPQEGFVERAEDWARREF